MSDMDDYRTATGSWTSDQMPLGDLMRGERATMGKSLLDVERDLKIKAAYIAAIENADVSAFTTKGFIAGYVRSYARYLGMDPDATFARFSAEAGFDGVHGTGVRPMGRRTLAHTPATSLPANDALAFSRIQFGGERESLFSRLEPGALGSALVLLMLVSGIGYGAWAILNDIQRLQFAPVEAEPDTLVEVDPLAGAGVAAVDADMPEAPDTPLPGADPLDRIYRPRPLDTPVFTPRDSAIATLDPDGGAMFGPPLPTPVAAPTDAPIELAGDLAADEAAVQVTERVEDEVILFVTQEAWVRVTAPSGTRVFERLMQPGEAYTLPVSEDPYRLRSGNSGAVFLMVNGVTMGPVGAPGSVQSNVALSADAITQTYQMADASADAGLPEVASLVLAGEATELNLDR